MTEDNRPSNNSTTFVISTPDHGKNYVCTVKEDNGTKFGKTHYAVWHTNVRALQNEVKRWVLETLEQEREGKALGWIVS